MPALDSNPQQQPAPGPAPDLEAKLAAEVGIDRDRMLAGRLTDAEWPTLITAHARLAARLPADERAELRALLDQIDAMAGQGQQRETVQPVVPPRRIRRRISGGLAADG